MSVQNISVVINQMVQQLFRQVHRLNQIHGMEPEIVIFGLLCLLYLTNKKALNNTWIKVVAVGLVFHLGITTLQSPEDYTQSTSSEYVVESENDTSDNTLGDTDETNLEYYGDSANFLAAPDQDVSDKFFHTSNQIGQAYQKLAPSSAHEFWSSVLGSSINKPCTVPLCTRSYSNWNPYQQQD